MTFLGFTGLVNFVTCISVAILVIFKNIRNPLNISFFNLNFSVALYSFGYFFWQLAKDAPQAAFWFKITVVGIILINITYLYFVFNFLDLINKKRKFLRVLVFANFVFIVLNFSSLLYRDFEIRYDLGFWPTPTIFFHIYLAFWFWQCCYGFYWLLKGLKLNTDLKRAQIKYFTISAVLGFAGGATNWPMWYKIHLPPYLNLTISLYIGIVAYAIFRYRLLNINILVARAAIFTSIYLFVLGIPFWLFFKERERLIMLLGENWAIVPLILGIVFASTGPFAYIYIQKKAEDRILKKQRRTQHVLEEKFKSITLVKDLDKVLKLIVRAITMVLRVDYSSVFLLDKRTGQYKLSSQRGYLHSVNDPIIAKGSSLINYIQEHRTPLIYEELKIQSASANSHDTIELTRVMKRIPAQVIIPSFINNDLIGFVVLGHKTTGEIYNEGDLLTLTRMSSSSALAIEYAQFLKEYEEVQVKLREAEKLKGIGQLMYSLNHEILNAFNLILPSVEMLLMGIYKDNQQKIEEFLKNIQTGVNRCMRVLGDIKSFRYKSASDVIRPRNIQELTHSALGGLSEEIKQENIQLNVTIEPNLPLIQAKDTLEDLPHNIISNCIYALEDKPGERRFLYINAYLSEDKKNIIFKTQDTGADITKDADTHDTGSPFKERARMGGVNLGLANLIVSAHNGTLTLNSYEKGGTTFIITLPISQEVL